jgi:hypothetical protein
MKVPIRHDAKHADQTATAIERAFQLANSGRCATVGGIRHALCREGRLDVQVTGPTLSRQLKALIKAARKLNASN